jgi:hypothetical protein
VTCDACRNIELSHEEEPNGAIDRRFAEEEPEPVPKELLPKTGDGQTHLDLIKGGAATLKKVDGPAERPLPTAEQIAAEKVAATEGA